MARLPLWKEAQSLAIEYEKRGIGYSYNQRNRNVYLSVLNAPYTVEGVEGCQITGYLTVFGGVKESRDIDRLVELVKNEYVKKYKNNSLMIKYAESIY